MKISTVSRRPASVLCSVFLAVGLASQLAAQTFYGSIVGTVTDASGASASGALVALVNTGTSDRRTAETDGSGNYQFVNLVPGKYRVEIQRSGFKRLSRDEIQVEVQATVRIDAVLQVGDAAQVIEVTAETPLLQTETSSLGQVVESRAVQQMPLNGRNVLNLVSLVPGVVPQGQSTGNPTNTNISAWGNYSIGGAIGNQSAAYLDGGPLNTSYNNAVMLVPTQDAIQEFRVQTNNLGAEFGRFGGGVINLTTKSGTNQFHGSAYEFLRNKELNANTFFNNRSGIARPAFTQNQFGTNVGGPVLKDKAFFFFSYEGFRLRQGQSLLKSVPTDAFKNGDFSNLRTATGTSIPIYDPATTCGVNGNPGCSGTILRTPFAGNTIPKSRFDRTAVALESLWAAPNQAGQNFTNINNFATNASTGGDNDQINIRGDQTIGTKQRLFARYTRWTDLNLPVDAYKSKTGNNITFGTQQAVLGDTYTLTPTTVLDVRGAFFRFTYQNLPQSYGADLTSYGWPANLNSQVTARMVPYPCVQNFSDFCQEVIGVTANNTFSLVPTLTKIAGRHTLKIGAEFRTLQFNFGKSNQASGVFNFDNIFTSQNPNSPGTTGYGWASYLLGLGATGQVPGTTGSPNGVQTYSKTAAELTYQAYYVSDQFQVNNKLTLNLGVRWDQPGPYTERFDRQSVWEPNAVSPLAKPTGLPLVGALGLVNSVNRSSRGTTDRHWNLFAPRVGFAYRLTPTTVVRGGYGIFFLPNDLTFDLSPHNSPVNTLITPWVSTLDSGLTPVATFSNPFPNGIIQPPARDASYQTILLGQSIKSPLPNLPYSNVQQWNFSVQREVFRGITVDLAYAGSKGTHLTAGSQQVNQLPDQYLSMGSALQKQVPNPFYGLITTGTLAAKTIQAGQLLLPYPQYSGVSVIADTNRDSTYHSLQTKVEKRFKEGGTVLASYTFSKSLSNADTLTGWLDTAGTTQNYNNLRGERSLVSGDVPHRLVFSYVVDLPVGKGKRFLANLPGPVSQVVSGWGVNGVSTFQRGFPLGLTTSSNLTNSFGGGSRPNVVPGCNKVLTGAPQSRIAQWFNTSCFTAPPAFTFGSEDRLDPKLRAAGIANYDFALFKSTLIRERFNLQFRTEFFNLFNRVQFSAPNATVGNTNFGVVSSQANTPRLVQFELLMTDCRRSHIKQGA